jgi:hypothetical protein
MTKRRRQNIEFMSGLEALRKGMDVRSRSTPGVIDSDRSSFSLAAFRRPYGAVRGVISCRSPDAPEHIRS